MSDGVGDVDLARMRRERRARLVDGFGAIDAGALLLLGQSNVRYATGADVLQADAARTAIERGVALLVAGDDVPHLFTPWRDGVPDGYPSDHVHTPVFLDHDDEARAFVAELAVLAGRPARVLVDEVTGSLLDALRTVTLGDAAPLLAQVRSRKTRDEIACIRRAQAVNEAAMSYVQPLVRDGVATDELSAALVRSCLDLGAEACVVEPIWQAMPGRAGDGPRTLKGGPAFPLATPGRTLARGDVVWVDAGISWAGYHSDFGRTWTVGTEPDAAQRAQFARWRAVVDAVAACVRPGATGDALTKAATDAAGGAPPWLPHLYLAHGIGLNSAERPLLGTDLGTAHDAGVALEEGTVFVLEPVVWEDGDAGYRSEEIVAVTADGFEWLSDHGYEPYT